MSVDFNAIASALATRFSAANITAPSGETNIRGATSAPPGQVPAEPYVFVLPPEPGGIQLTYNAGTLSGIAEFPVRLYLRKIRTVDRNTTLANKWLGSLYLQLMGQVQLGLSSYVTHAVIRDLGAAELVWGGEKFEGIALTAEVHIWEGLSPTA